MSVLNRLTIKEVLELSENPIRAEVDKNCRRLVKQWHPDVNKSPEAAEYMKRINKAYAIVTGKEAPPRQPMSPSQGPFVITQIWPQLVARCSDTAAHQFRGLIGVAGKWRFWLPFRARSPSSVSAF